tara:strand:- start:619 stop:744 length:126 start_codon:yes stop_codon:yes gene_type:complete
MFLAACSFSLATRSFLTASARDLRASLGARFRLSISARATA